jgi:hypothetical protein
MAMCTAFHFIGLYTLACFCHLLAVYSTKVWSNSLGSCLLSCLARHSHRLNHVHDFSNIPLRFCVGWTSWIPKTLRQGASEQKWNVQLRFDTGRITSRYLQWHCSCRDIINLQSSVFVANPLIQDRQVEISIIWSLVQSFDCYPARVLPPYIGVLDSAMWPRTPEYDRGVTQNYEWLLLRKNSRTKDRKKLQVFNVFDPLGRRSEG